MEQKTERHILKMAYASMRLYAQCSVSVCSIICCQNSSSSCNIHQYVTRVQSSSSSTHDTFRYTFIQFASTTHSYSRKSTLTRTRKNVLRRMNDMVWYETLYTSFALAAFAQVCVCFSGTFLRAYTLSPETVVSTHATTTKSKSTHNQKKHKRIVSTAFAVWLFFVSILHSFESKAHWQKKSFPRQKEVFCNRFFSKSIASVWSR